MSYVITRNGKPIPFATKRKKQTVKDNYYNDKQIKIFTFSLDAVASPLF